MKDETVHLAPAAMPTILKEGEAFVSKGSVVMWLRACAADSTEVPANTCKALANFMETWK